MPDPSEPAWMKYARAANRVTAPKDQGQSVYYQQMQQQAKNAGQPKQVVIPTGTPPEQARARQWFANNRAAIPDPLQWLWNGLQNIANAQNTANYNYQQSQTNAALSAQAQAQAALLQKRPAALPSYLQYMPQAALNAMNGKPYVGVNQAPAPSTGPNYASNINPLTGLPRQPSQLTEQNIPFYSDQIFFSKHVSPVAGVSGPQQAANYANWYGENNPYENDTSGPAAPPAGNTGGGGGGYPYPYTYPGGGGGYGGSGEAVKNWYMNLVNWKVPLPKE